MTETMRCRNFDDCEFEIPTPRTTIEVSTARRNMRKHQLACDRSTVAARREYIRLRRDGMPSSGAWTSARRRYPTKVSA